jgi:16S rRNA (uracil1498-N3)-methyltransferase
MSSSRYYIESFHKGENELTGSEAHHLTTVMRARPGISVEVFDGKGSLGNAVVVNISKRSVLLNVTGVITEKPRRNGRVILAVSPPKGNRWDWLASKATEIGVDYIAPVLYERSVRQGNTKSFVEKTAAVCIAAAKQCGRLYVPKIIKPLGLNQFLTGLCNGFALRAVVMSLSRDTISIDRINPDWQKENILIFVGPEGGFTEEEEILTKSHFQANCFYSARMTKTVLRTETAALSASAFFCCKRDSFE